MKLNRIFKLGITTFASVFSLACVSLAMTTDIKISDNGIKIVQSSALAEETDQPLLQTDSENTTYAQGFIRRRRNRLWTFKWRGLNIPDLVLNISRNGDISGRSRRYRDIFDRRRDRNISDNYWSGKLFRQRRTRIIRLTLEGRTYELTCAGKETRRGTNKFKGYCYDNNGKSGVFRLRKKFDNFRFRRLPN